MNQYDEDAIRELEAAATPRCLRAQHRNEIRTAAEQNRDSLNQINDDIEQVALAGRPDEVAEVTNPDEDNALEQILDIEQNVDPRGDIEPEQPNPRPDRNVDNCGRTIDWKIELQNLYKITSNMKKYAKQDYSEFKVFEDKLRNTVRKLSILSGDCYFWSYFYSDN